VKPASAALIALLNSGEQFIMADLYTFTLVGGSVLRYSAAPTEIVANGYTFALGPKFERSKTNVVIGTQVDELDIMAYPEETDLVGDTLFLQAAWQGQFDGALLQLERAFMPTYGDTSAGTVVLFAGRISDINCARTGIDMKCRSHLELLNIQMPRRLWQSSCTHVFGGQMCGYNRVAGTNALGVATGAGALIFAAAAGSTTTVILGAPSTTTPYALGTILGMTGANTGYSRTIYGFASGASVSTKLAFLFPVSPGDEFQILPGCDRSVTTCTNVFNNMARFGGFPYIPTPETAV
jgi:uncharacterized phage protein (TIGR02218 family)